jgi:hypothetical protein
MAIAAATLKRQAISGVSPGVENIVRVEYPSIAATYFGMVIGQICDSIPVKINGVKLSYLLFGLPVAPIALLVYIWLKVFGERYVLTNKAVQKWSAIGDRLTGQVALAAFSDILITRRPGQDFYHAADLELLAADGSVLLRLEGVLRPDVIRQSILEARDAQLKVEASLKTIQARRG